VVNRWLSSDFFTSRAQAVLWLREYAWSAWQFDIGRPLKGGRRSHGSSAMTGWV
jgi:hypothetical protein